VKCIKSLLPLAVLVLWAGSTVAQPGSTGKKSGAAGKTVKTPGPADDENGAAASPEGKKSSPKEPAAPRPSGTLAANGPRGASWQAEDSYVEILRLPNKRPLLVIHYPWKVHVRASVEVRQLAADERDTGEIRPMGFVARVMKGEVTAAVYQCQDRSAEVPAVRKMKHEGKDFELLGEKNRLGSGSVCAVFAPKPEDKNPIVRVAYPLLGSWALDDRTLVLELPEAYFAEPCWIRVWLLREGEMVWWKTVRWPGGTK
jgi:hypothetical protein